MDAVGPRAAVAEELAGEVAVQEGKPLSDRARLREARELAAEGAEVELERLLSPAPGDDPLLEAEELGDADLLGDEAVGVKARVAPPAGSGPEGEGDPGGAEDPLLERGGRVGERRGVEVGAVADGAGLLPPAEEVRAEEDVAPLREPAAHEDGEDVGMGGGEVVDAGQHGPSVAKA